MYQDLSRRVVLHLARSFIYIADGVKIAARAQGKWQYVFRNLALGFISERRFSFEDCLELNTGLDLNAGIGLSMGLDLFMGLDPKQVWIWT